MEAPVAVAGHSVWRGTELAESDWLVAADRPVAEVARRLWEGPGMAVVRGLELAGLDDGACLAAGRRYLGGLGAVRPEDAGRPGDGLVVAVAGQDPGGLDLHTDRAMHPGPPRLLGLLCVRPAASGGESVLVSGHAVHDALLGTRPEVLPDLYRDFHFGDEPDLERRYPVFRRRGGRLDVQYNRYWIGRGQRERGQPLTAGQLAGLDAFEEVLADPGLALRVRLRRGDLLVLDNAAVLHGRTAFGDPPGAEAVGRCMARIWAD
ncbi:TauD/TfdA family dioxygenase [Kitasatospora sp. NPDC096147]|uniref:TauD/TfdA family dioxygenase n=1 Tax=Kitasatospora sp. NPDC096147 TaxID=3364093 RepID=UPI0037FDB9C4